MMKKVLLMTLVSSFFLSTPVEVRAESDLCESDCKMEYQFFSRYSRDGSSVAYLAMAIMNYRGYGRDVNIETANKLLKRAARMGEPVAQYQLGYFLNHGMYFEQDKKSALSWFKKSSRYGVLDSQQQVAKLTKELSAYSAKTTSLQNAGFGLIRSDLALDESERSAIKHSQKQSTYDASSDVKIDEIIKITANFTWADVLDAANKQTQTCLPPKCLPTPSKAALMPVITLKKDRAI